MSPQQLDYQTPRRGATRSTKYWIAFAVAATAGLVPASIVDEVIYHSRTGHYPDGGATIISAAGIPFAAIVAAFVRLAGGRAMWIAAICGVLACPITVAILYAAF